MWGWRPDPSKYPGLAEALQAGRWQPSGLLDRLPWTVFDTETTGFHPHGGDEVISLAAVRLGEALEFDSLVNPGRTIPGQVEDLTGITDAEVRKAPPLLNVLEQFFRFAGQSVLVAHCADFDRAFVEAKLRKAARLRWTHPLLDTMTLSRALFPNWGDYRLEHCAPRLQTMLEGRHTALGDARSTARVLQALLGECAARGVNTWEELRWFLQYRQLL